MIDLLMGWCCLIGAALLVVTIMAAFEADGGMGLALFCVLFATGPVAGVVIGIEHKQIMENQRAIQKTLAAPLPKMAEAVSAPMVATVECSCSCDAQGRRRLDISTPAKENP